MVGNQEGRLHVVHEGLFKPLFVNKGFPHSLKWKRKEKKESRLRNCTIKDTQQVREAGAESHTSDSPKISNLPFEKKISHRNLPFT